MSLFPSETTLPTGEKYPGYHNGVFTDGDPSKNIPAKTLNLILNNLQELIEAGLGGSNNNDINQLLRADENRIRQVSLKWINSWSYQKNDIVQHEGHLFRAVQDNRNKSPFSNLSDWLCLTMPRIGQDFIQLPGSDSPGELYPEGTWLDISNRAWGYIIRKNNQRYSVTRKSLGQSGLCLDTDYNLNDSLNDSSVPVNYKGAVVKKILSHSGMFLRINGGKALAFESGIQLDSFQGHKHSGGSVVGDRGYGFDLSAAGGGAYDRRSNISNYMDRHISDGHGPPRISSETRPVNETIKLFKLVGIKGII